MWATRYVSNTSLFKSVRWKLVIIYVLLILFSMQLAGLYFVRSFNQYFLGNFQSSLKDSATSIARLFALAYEENSQPNTQNLQELVRFASLFTNSQIYVLDRNAIIVNTSDSPSLIGEKRVESEVTRTLLDKNVQMSIRAEPDDARKRYMYLAVPILSKSNAALGAVDIVAPMQTIYATINSIERIFLSGTIVALVLTILIGVPLARTITEPVVEITHRARAMARGNFTEMVKVNGDDEIGQLGMTFNYLTQQLRTALHEKEQETRKLEVVLANVGEGVIAIGSDASVMFVNPTARLMLDLSNERVVLTDVPEVFRSLLKSQSDDEGDPTHEVIYEDQQGSRYAAYAVPFLIGDSHKGGHVIVLRDVTEHERMEQARRDFVANVSHEIRTPLTTIRSYVEALTDGAMSDPELAKKFLGVIESESDRMTRLVTELLQLSRLDERKEVWLPREESIHDLLFDATDRFVIQAQARGMTLQVDIPADLPAVVLDRDKFAQVMDNILSNAFKYTSDGGRVHVSAKRDRNAVVVEIADSGAGIPKKDLPYVFDRFFRVDKGRSRRLGGAGLGLAIAKEIVERHGGEIHIHSEVDRGTSVMIHMPVLGGSVL